MAVHLALECIRARFDRSLFPAVLRFPRIADRMIRIVPLLMPELTTYYVIIWNPSSTRHASCGTPRIKETTDIRIECFLIF